MKAAKSCVVHKGIILCIFLGLILLILVYFHFLTTAEVPKNDEQFCTIETFHGRVRGMKNQTLFDKKLFYSFRGIPYAKPPIDELRFKAPQKSEPWNGTLDAFEFSNECVQFDKIDNYFGSEDCLYLNVFVPLKCSEIVADTKLPVFVYIFGGGFFRGSTQEYGPDFLIDENVIVVTLNYRLGILGFLNLRTPEYSGNMGLKDQNLALNWVNENIERFGGDKNKVTIGGHSAGAVSVHFHLLSSSSSHLFQRVIALSGSILGPLQPDEGDHSKLLFNLAQRLNFSASDTDFNFIDFLNQVDQRLLQVYTFQPIFLPMLGRKRDLFTFGCSVEASNAIQPFITQTPLAILADPTNGRDKDVLFSNTLHEDVISDEEIDPVAMALDDSFEFDLPLGELQINISSEIYKNISNLIRNFYFGGGHVSRETKDILDSLVSDIDFLYGIDLSARIQSNHSTGRTYFSEFRVETDFNLSIRRSKDSNYTIKYGAHPDQVYYLFRFSKSTPQEVYENLSEDSLPRQIIKNVAKFYANFIKFGDPMPSSNDSAEFKPPGFNYFNMTNYGILPIANGIRDRFDFWDTIFNDHKQYWNLSFDFH